jgi:truncated hemoglobin YjbI/predicted pyridoxine 5'-phosphate oxidase superfamily flavin-nucleotide-binding protein
MNGQEEEWHIASHDQTIGPVSRSEFVDRIEKREIVETTLVWRPGFSDWREAGAVERGLFLRLRASAQTVRQALAPSVRGLAEIDAGRRGSATAGADKVAPSGRSASEPVSKWKNFGFSRGKAAQQPSQPADGGADKGSEAKRPDSASVDERPTAASGNSTPSTKKPSLLPGSEGEHMLQEKYGTKDRALAFYDRQVLSYLAPAMREFLARQEFLFVATADHRGECDCTSKFGEPGFIRVLSDKHLIYPEYRGNGVFANSGNISENSHIGLLIIDFYQDAVGLHVNGKARLVENDELLAYAEKLPEKIFDELALAGKRRPERWVMVEVEEAYIQCSKHIPRLKKLDRKIDWGTDSVAAKKGDYFQLQGLPLYDRLGGDKAMEVAVDVFYRKVLQDDLVGRFFEDVDMEAQRLKQKSFLAMAFGGPYQYSALDLRKAHGRLVEKMGLTDQHFERVLAIFRQSMEEIEISKKEIDEMMIVLESARDDILNR